MRAPFAEGTRHQREYEVVALVTIATRAAVSGGVDVDTAFSLSDLYLKKSIGTERKRSWKRSPWMPSVLFVPKSPSRRSGK